MILIFEKIHRYGIRRSFVFAVIIIICKIKGFFWRVLLSDNKPVLNGAKIFQPTQFVGRGKIKIESSCIGVWPSPNILNGISYIEARNMVSSVYISKSTFINNNAVIIADKTSIKIGSRCLIGQNLFVTDSDFHGLSINNRSNGYYECYPVNIGDDVFIGADVAIMKGVSIGNGAVIGSGSVVIKDVEPNSIYAGVPAKFVKKVPVS